MNNWWLIKWWVTTSLLLTQKWISCSPTNAARCLSDLLKPSTSSQNLHPRMQSSSPSLGPSLPDFFSGFNNSLQWFSPRRHRCNNPGHHWKASSMCAEEISAVAPQTQICDALSHWVRINFIFLLPPLSWIPPRTQNKSRGGCRPQADSFTFSEAWFIEPFCTCAVGLVAVLLGRQQRAHRAAAACTHNQSFVWVITAADLPSVVWLFHVIRGSALQRAEHVVMAPSMVGKKRKSVHEDDTKGSFICSQIYQMGWVSWLDNWFSQAPFKAWTHNLPSNY